MSIQNRDDEALRDFFSAYFHEDWPCEADTPADVVSSYVSSAPPSEVERLRGAIIRLVENEQEDAGLEKKLMPELGCYYLPSADGLTAKKWLLEVADLMNARRPK